MLTDRKYLALTLCLAALLVAIPASAATDKTPGDNPIVIKLEKPVYVLPRFTGKFREKEVSVAPDEYEIADRLRELLDAGKTEEVMAELDAFYDIELSVAMLTLKAQIFFSLEKFAEAEKTYLAAIARKPHLIRAHADLGQLYLLTDRPLKARESFAKAVAFGANDAVIHGQLGYLNLTHFGPYTAISEYQQALAIEPDNSQWQQGLLAALSQAKMFESAQALITELLAKEPENIDLWLNKAALAMEQGATEEALSSMEMALLMGDQDRVNLKATVQLHLQLGSYHRAVELINQDIALHSVKMKTIDEYLSWLRQAEMYDQAQEVLQTLQPQVANFNNQDESLYHYQRAEIYTARNASTQADSAFQRAIDLDPTNGRALIGYARYNQNKKQYAQAEMLYMRAAGMDDFAKSATLGKAQLYIDMLDYRAALEALREAYTRYPDMIGLKDNIETVESIIRANDNNQS